MDARDDGTLSIENPDALFPDGWSEEKVARARTLFLKRLSVLAHRFYGGKLQVLPRAGLYGPGWFGAWYTPGVSAVSTAVRDDPEESFALTGRGNLVAVLSDSTRVLGDGDCGPSGGLGVMEGKAFLMKYLGGVDAVPLCMDSRGPDGKPDWRRIVDFAKMAAPSFGAINLEDISQPNCFFALDALRDACGIPVWHDDAQGTACVTLAGLLNALKLAGKRLADARIVLLGAGAANTALARLLMADGADPARLALFDKEGGLHSGRADLERDPSAYRQWELAKLTNPARFATPAEALRGADALVALSAPGPGTVKREWVRSMAEGAIVFACANPVPEIWPFEAKEEGAFVVATGRGDFPNQVNNSVCFPGILKGALLVRARGISDGMAIRCAHSLADFAKDRPGGVKPDDILPSMEDTEVFAVEAADVAEEAAKEGLARTPLPHAELRARAAADIAAARASYAALMDGGHIPRPDPAMIREAAAWAMAVINED
ncbi:MAG: NADP-dependent malic enzyme [Spirochaetales bacterium]|nr:NADP-dependent malic enzyme [Spirochaetales bacterium]